MTDLGPKISIHDVEWHRNGVACMGFWSIRFSFLSEEGIRLNMHATLFSEEGFCAVHDLDDMTSKWRGDWFESHLRQKLKDHEDSLVPARLKTR